MVMPFGLKKAQAISQRTMERILIECLGVCCEAYIDDSSIYSDTEAQHSIDVKKVFRALNDVRMKMKTEKILILLFVPDCLE